MSKTIESLKKIPSREDILHGHIADTYFHQKANNKKGRDVIAKLKLIFTVSSLLAILFITIALFLMLYSHYLGIMREKTANSTVIKIFDGGHLNNEIIDSFEFRGYAKDRSKLSNKLIVLNNTKKYNWADISMDFKFPVDFSNRILSLTLKGKIGGERANLILRDINNRSYKFSDIYLASNWKIENISFDDIKEDIDLSKITHLRFESGYVGESSEKMDSFIDVTIYIKNILISKKGKRL